MGCGVCCDWGSPKIGNLLDRFVIPVLPSLGYRFDNPGISTLGFVLGSLVFVHPGCRPGDHLGGVREVEKGSLSWQAGLSLFVS